MKKKKPVLYVASPLLYSEIGRSLNKQMLLFLLSYIGFDIRDPWTPALREKIAKVAAMRYGEEKRQAWSMLNIEIAHYNEKAIRECDIMVAVLDGVDVDSGTASQIGFAAALGKRIEGYRGDLRLSADNEGSIVNLQIEHFIHQSGGEIVMLLTDLGVQLENYLDQFQ